jgi:iron complex outermembrane receptor protein
VQSVRVVGTRRVGASSATDTPVPVDIIPMTRLAEQGSQFDLAQTLTNISPSFNSTRQSGADGADLVDSAALRGLGSDQTLVLVNGKRRHTTALVNLFGARNRGNTGTDMNAIPLLAIRNVQVLRDGAAAQYGSDAIAGVMNIELKKSLGCEAVAGYGQYSKGDGENYLASAYCGIAVAGGTFGVTGEYLFRDRSNRAEAGNPRIIGDSKTENQTVYINGEIPARPGPRLHDGRRAAARRFVGRVRARRPRLRRHPVAQFGGHVPERFRPLHQRRPRRPLRHARLPPPSSASGMRTSRRPTATTASTTRSPTP